MCYIINPCSKFRGFFGNLSNKTQSYNMRPLSLEDYSVNYSNIIIIVVVDFSMLCFLL